MNRLPEDWKEVTASVYVKGREIVITGTPEEDSAHNCDHMGCGSIEHVLYRGKLEMGNEFEEESSNISNDEEGEEVLQENEDWTGSECSYCFGSGKDNLDELGYCKLCDGTGVIQPY